MKSIRFLGMNRRPKNALKPKSNKRGGSSQEINTLCKEQELPGGPNFTKHQLCHSFYLLDRYDSSARLQRKVAIHQILAIYVVTKKWWKDL